MADQIDAGYIEHFCLDAPSLTQTELAETLRRSDDAIAHLVAKMLDPRGYYGWRLVLKRSGRGAPGDRYNVMGPEHHYEVEVAESGKRGAIKRVAQLLNMSPEAVRSALRRGNGTHSPRRKKSGRK
jgi:hypothetical protein